MKNLRFLPYSRQYIDQSDINSVIKVLKSDFITQGPQITKFEDNFAKKVGAKYAVACATGTAALHISCLALGITKKSNVLTSSITFVASANCSEFIGSNVDFVDIEKNSPCMSVNSLEQKLKNKKIDLVIPVHMSGQSCDMKKIYQLKKKYKFKIIEDSCHALGGKYYNYNVGSCKFSDICTFSFHPVKPITTGEGGMITTNSKKIYEKLLLYRTHGIHKNHNHFVNETLAYDKNGKKNRWYYEMSHLGYNYRITDIQASLGSSQLKKLETATKKRQQIAKMYIKYFKNTPNLMIQPIPNNIYHAYHLFTILINFNKINMSKTELMEKLQSKNIGSQVLYIPVFLQPYYQKKYNFKKKEFPNSMNYYEKCLSIPIFYDLKLKEVKFVANEIKKIIS